MTDDQMTGRNRSRKGLTWAAGLVTAGALTGGVLAGATSASAATETSSPPVTAAADAGSATPAVSGNSGGQPQNKDQFKGWDGAAPVRGDEKQLTGTDAEKARATALQAVPGGTVYRVETDAGDAQYEAHMKKADGSLVTVKLDKNFALIKVEDGMGAGDPAPSGRSGPRQSG